MARQHHRALALQAVDHGLARFLAELAVADREHFVYEQDVRVEIHRRPEAESGAHPIRVGGHPTMDGVAQARHPHHVRHPGQRLAPRQPGQHAVHDDVARSGELHVEAGVERQQSR